MTLSWSYNSIAPTKYHLYILKMALSIPKLVLIRPQEGTSASLTFFLVLTKILACKKWEQAINKGGKFFDHIYGSLQSFHHNLPFLSNRHLLLAKLKLIDFSWSVLNIICSHLKNRQSRDIIRNKMNSSETILVRAPHGFNKAPLLFNLIISCLLVFLHSAILRNYTDDNNLYVTDCTREWK